MTVPDEVEAQVLDKATSVEEAMSVLTAKQSLDEEEYRADREQRAVVEHGFHTAVEACIDIAGLLLGTTDATMPETYAERFQMLEGRDILPYETSVRMQQAAGVRNVLAHRYGDDAVERFCALDGREVDTPRDTGRGDKLYDGDDLAAL